MRKDLVVEVCIASGGILAGSIIPAYVGFTKWQANAATGSDLLAMLLFAAALAAFAVTLYQWTVRLKMHVDLVTEIRNRPKVPVQHIT